MVCTIHGTISSGHGIFPRQGSSLSGSRDGVFVTNVSFVLMGSVRFHPYNPSKDLVGWHVNSIIDLLPSNGTFWQRPAL